MLTQNIAHSAGRSNQRREHSENMPYKAKISVPIIVVAIIGVIVAASIYSYTNTPSQFPTQGMMGEEQGSLTIDDSMSVTQKYLGYVGDSDLAVVEIMEFSNHFYVDVYEQSTGIHAFELIMERDGDIYPEYGPNMMWNTKYDHHGGGMMGTYSESVSMPVNEDESIVYAQKYLDKNMPGTTAGGPNMLYGYLYSSC
ncbi:MAG: hypothetical protein ABIH76_00595 [Candidatus Bathyarchaeota archaeon]